MANGNGDTGYIESARKSGRALTGKEMTKGRQSALKSLIKRDSPQNAFSAAEQELARRQRGIGGKGMVR